MSRIWNQSFYRETKRLNASGQLADTKMPKGYTVEPDRRKAIGISIAAARKGDTILIAGKGHETYQILGGQTISFDDKEVAADLMASAGKTIE